MKIQLQKAATLAVAVVRILATAVILSPLSQASDGENSSVAEPAVREMLTCCNGIRRN